MGGFFGVVSSSDCITDLFYGTDYHSHLGNLRGGLMTMGPQGFKRVIHDISNAPFRAKFQDDLPYLRGPSSGIGCISDTGDQPLLMHSHLGTYGVVMVGAINNLDELTAKACNDYNVHFSEVGNEGVNPNEVAAAIVFSGKTIADGMKKLQRLVCGSCSMLLLGDEGIYAMRDALGRTPITIGIKEGARAVSFEGCAIYNLGYSREYELGPGEAVLVTKDGVSQLLPPGDKMQICSFLWVYFGFPATSYEGRNIEMVRYNCGAKLAEIDEKRNDPSEKEMVVGVPDSGVAHALGYSNQSHIPYKRAFIKYTPTWARSFIPRDQKDRAHVATMKLVPIEELIRGRKLLFCEDSVVRGTQLGNTLGRLRKFGVSEIHLRSACPPILYNCRFLNFSKANGLKGLIARRAIAKVEGYEFTGNTAEDEAWLANVDMTEYHDEKSPKFAAMVEAMRQELALDSLHFQSLDDLIEAIGLPRERLCTYCWDGKDECACEHCSGCCHGS